LGKARALLCNYLLTRSLLLAPVEYAEALISAEAAACCEVSVRKRKQERGIVFIKQ
jgi:hypothetical protein